MASRIRTRGKGSYSLDALAGTAEGGAVMDIALLYMLLIVWLIDVIFTFWCTVQVYQDLERMEELYKKMEEKANE